jgi:hypothetical protein
VGLSKEELGAIVGRHRTSLERSGLPPQSTEGQLRQLDVESFEVPSAGISRSWVSSSWCKAAGRRCCQWMSEISPDPSSLHWSWHRFQ